MSDKRKRLLESALELFVLNGFQGTPTSQVAKHADVATGTLFHHFETKADLIQGVYRSCCESRADKCIISDKSLSIEQRIKDLFLARIEWGMANANSTTYINRFENSEFAKSYSGPAPDQDLITLIQDGQSNRKLRLVDADLMRLSIESLLASNTSFYTLFPEKYQDEMHRYASFNFFWTALKY
jgi:AcrR family transcriptional regulator